jgi:hypothetical protein
MNINELNTNITIRNLLYRELTPLKTKRPPCDCQTVFDFL